MDPVPGSTGSKLELESGGNQPEGDSLRSGVQLTLT